MSPSHLLSLAKTNSVLAGSGLVGAAGVGTVGWNSIGGYQFTANPLQGFEKEFETQRLNTDKPDNIFGLKDGNCYRRFFPGVHFTKPTKFDADTSNIKQEPEGVDLSGDAIGCGLVKFSQTKDKRGFIYKSEFAIKNESQGLSISFGLSNLKEAAKVYYEVWLTFLKKDGDKWYKDQDRGWHAIFDPWSSPSIQAQLLTQVYISGTRTSLAVPKNYKLTSSDIQSKYKTAESWDAPTTTMGIWTPNAAGSNTNDFLVSGSLENWGLRVYYGAVSANNSTPQFLVNTKLTQRGLWRLAEHYCGAVKEQHGNVPTAASSRDKELCYTYR